MQETLLAIAGKPGLYKLVARGNGNLIVEAIDETHRRLPAGARDRVHLSDIRKLVQWYNLLAKAGYKDFYTAPATEEAPETAESAAAPAEEA